MAIAALSGSKSVFIGPNPWLSATFPSQTPITLDAVNEAIIMFGRVETSDGASHTIDTSGSSSIQWMTGPTVVFADVGTTLKVGIANVDTSTGPPCRPVNSANVITFDVSASLTGGGGGVVAASWRTHVPTAGTKTIANGDLVAVCIQMTARGGTDAVDVNVAASSTALNRPGVTSYTGGAYAVAAAVPLMVIVFSDGALGMDTYG